MNELIVLAILLGIFESVYLLNEMWNNRYVPVYKRLIPMSAFVVQVGAMVAIIRSIMR